MSVVKMEKTETPGIYKRGGSYVVVYRDPDGNQRKRFTPNYKAARTLKASLTTDVKRGEFIEPSRVRFDDYAREWVANVKGIRETTRATYVQALEQRAIPHFNRNGRALLSSITPAHLKGYLTAVAAEVRTVDGVERPVSGSTVANAVKPVRALLRDAAEDGVIRQNPAANLRLPKREADPDAPDAEDVRYLTPEQLAAFLRIVHPKHRLFFQALADTGLRVSEITALQWRHVELDGSTPCFKVRRAFVKGRIHPPKSKFGRRNVPLSAALVNALRAQRSASEWPGDDAPVFPNEDGGTLLESNLRRRYLDPVMQEIGASGLGFHAFRHTAASRMIARGDSAVQVQRFLGHHSPGFTLATYVHLFPGDGAAPLDHGEETTPASFPDAWVGNADGQLDAPGLHLN